LKRKQKPREWSEIGWQGINIPVPADWHLARVQGTREKGYLRVDDDARVRLELRWEKPAKRPPKFSVLADNMLAHLRKFSRNRKAPFSVRRGVRLASPAGKECECFETRGDGVSYGCLARCTTCGRVLLARVTGLPKEDLRPIAGRIFNGINDHPGDDGLDHWNVYDLKFALPPAYKLVRTRLRTGAIELFFTGRKREVDIRRLGLASLMLKDRTLRNLFINYCYKELRYFDYYAREMTVNGHEEGVGLTGPKSLKARLLSNAGGRRFVHGYAWRCDDRIYIFRMTTPDAEDPIFFDLAGRVECHEKAGQTRPEAVAQTAEEPND